jgi:beta-lactamase superfamily II metal-dependent hydrolase
MKLRVFHSDKGDCLLVSGANGGKLLSDGGMKESFTRHVAKHLADEEEIDLVCISHVDDDHIAGVLELLDNAMKWKVFDHHRKEGDDDFNEPNVPKAPRIKRLWHNAFHDQVGENAGEIGDLLAQMVPMLAEMDDTTLQEAALENQAIISSNQQAIRVSQRVKPDQLDIPLNENDKLIMVRKDKKARKFGSLSCKIVAPFEDDLAAFRKAWNQWLADNKEVVKKLRSQARKDAGELADDVSSLLAPSLAGQILGDRTKVTPPNLASIMIHVEDGDATLLLTGDGHADDAIKGLQHLGLLDGQAAHFDVLKVQHHGSEHNMTGTFAKNITADNYVFCGNGFSGNPELIVLETIFDARVNGAGPNRDFKFWFNSSKASETKQDRLKHMIEVELLIGKLSAKNGRLKSFFLGNDDFFEFKV